MSSRRNRPSRSRALVWLLTACAAALGVGVYLASVRGVPAVSSPVTVPWWLIAAGFLAAEYFVVHFEFRGEAHSVTLSEIPLILGLFFVAPDSLLIAQLVGTAVALLMVVRQPVMKAVFNLALGALVTCVAIAVFHGILSAEPVGAVGWSAAYFASLSASALGVAGVFVAISATQGAARIGWFSKMLIAGLAATAANTSFGLVATVVVWHRPQWAWLLAVPAATVVTAYRGYSRLRSKQQSLEFLHETTRVIHSSPELESSLVAILELARHRFSATAAEIVFYSEKSRAYRTAIGVEPVAMQQMSPPNPVPELAGGGAAIVERGAGPQWGNAYCMREGVREAIVAPIRRGEKMAGTMRVSDRLGDAGSFSPEDAALFETLASHLSMSLDNGMLQQSLDRLSRESDKRRRVEDELRSAEAKYRSLVEDVPAVVYIARCDRAGSWSYTSPQIESITGFSSEQWLSSPLWSANLHAEDRDRVLNLRAELLASKTDEPFVAEYRLATRSGRYVWVRDEASIVRDEGRALFLRGVLSDISRRKEAEQEKHALEVQLRQSQKLEAVGELAGGVAHDFNNLLAVIRNYAQFVAQSLGPDESPREDVNEIIKAADRASALVRQLLTFSRKEIIRPRELDLNAAIRELEGTLRRTLRANISPVLHLEEHLWPVVADAAQIHQMLLNLLVNAQDAMPGGGTLVVETSTVEMDDHLARQFEETEPGCYICLTVSDTGHGMSADTKSRIFEPFFTTKGRASGTGLGLSSVYGIVKRARGEIAVYSKPGLGTTFKVYLPAAGPARAGAAERLAEEPAGGALQTVLVADEDESVRNAVERVLSPHGYRVLAAATPEAAHHLARAYEGSIELFMSDAAMAESEIVRGVEAPAILISGHPREIVARSGGPERAVLQKPFTAARLLEVVRSALDERARL